MAKVDSQHPLPRWKALCQGPLLAGLCFGAAYGITQRLMSFNVAELIHFGPGFDVQVFPGTSLESLKLRFGNAEAEIQGNLELQELERQQQEEAKKRAEDARKAEAELQRAQRLDPIPEPVLPEPAPSSSSPSASTTSASTRAPAAPLPPPQPPEIPASQP